MTADGRPAEISFAKSVKKMESELDGFNRRVRSKTAAAFGFSPSDLKALKDFPQGQPKAMPKEADAHVRAFRQAEREAARSAREVERINAQTARQAVAQAKLRERAAKSLADFETREARRTADEFVKGLGRQREEHARHVTDLKRGAAAVGAALLVVGALIFSTLSDSFTRAASFDSLKRGLAAVEGSSEAANSSLEKLRETAKLPGLGLREAIQGYTNLRAVKLNAELSERALTAFGNALATVGKGRAELEGVVLALTQIVSKGKVSAEEINQIAERVPQIREAMKQAFGTADTEELQKRGLAPEQFIEGIVSQLEKLPKASGGAQNALENLADAYDQALVTLGEPLLAPVAEEMEAVSSALERNKESVREWGQVFADVLRGVRAIAESEIGTVIGYLLRLAKMMSILQPLETLGVISRSGSKQGALPSVPQVAKVFDAGNAVTVDPKTMRPVVAASKEAQKQLEKQQDLVADLRREIQFFGDRSQRAAVMQRLLAAGVTDTNSGLAAQALHLAEVIDKMRDRADVEELMRKKEKEAEEFKKDLGEQLREAARDARRRALDMENEMAGFKPTERFRFDKSTLGQQATSMGATVAEDLKEAQEAFSRVDKAASDLEPFRKRKAAAESLRGSFRSLAETMLDAAAPAKDKFEELVRSLAANEHLPAQFAAGFREARRSFEEWTPNEVLVQSADVQRARDFRHIIAEMLRTLKDGGGQILLTAGEVQELAGRLADAAGGAIDFNRALREKEALESFTSAMKELEEVISKDVELTHAQRVEKLLLTDAYKNLTDAQREQLRGAAAGADAAEATRKATEEARNNLENLTSVVAGGIDAAIRDKWRGLMSYIIEEFKRTLTQLLASWLASRFLRAIGAAAPGGGAAQQGGGISWRNLFNLGGGQGSGGGGGLDVAGAVGGGRSGGFTGALKGLLGLGQSAASGGASGASSMASAAALIPGVGDAAALAGAAGLAGGGGGAGGLGSAAGAAMSGGGGAGGFGGLMPLLTNPWTIGIAAAAVGGFMLWKAFSNRTEKELRKAIRSEYQVDVKDMQLLKQVKALGEQNFGKGQVRKHLQETVRLDQVKELVSQYAESTGQTGSKLVADKQLADAGNQANNFIRRSSGGPVEKGRPYIVGDGGPRQYWEVFVPDESGRIEPSVGSYQRSRGTPLKKVMERVRAKLAESSASPAGGSQAPQIGRAPQAGVSPALLAALVGAVNRMADAAGSLEAIDPDSVVGKARPATVAGLTAQGFEESGRARRSAQNSLGLGGK